MNLNFEANKKNFVVYLKLMRIDHWIKNLFMFPGAAFALALYVIPKQIDVTSETYFELTLSFIALCLSSSANYVLNEWLDKDFDSQHPYKNHRVSNRYNLQARGVVLLYSFLLFVVAAIIFFLNFIVASCIAILLFMGLLYNVKPIRLKDKFYLDVISESVNNPIRLAIGWYAILPNTVLPISAFIGFWGMGIFLMSLKRYSEMKLINDSELLGSYRASFLYWTPEKLLTFAMVGAVISASFLGILLARHRLEYVLLFPIIIWVFALYLDKSLKLDPLSYAPEKLIRNKKLMVLLFLLLIFFIVLTINDLKFLYGFVDLSGN